ADLDDAEKQLFNCDIRAPVTGTVLTKKAEFGNYVNPVGFNVSASLCEMADLRAVEIELDVQERDLPLVVPPRKVKLSSGTRLVVGAVGGLDLVTPGQKVTVMPEAFQRDAVFTGKYPHGYLAEVSRLMPTANRAKGAVPVRVKVTVPEAEAGLYLKPDMGALVSFRKPGK